jgi:hypothetical protein
MLNGDIKFWEPESMLPDDTNGGQMTHTEIISGQVGNLVPPIAEADRVSGSVAGYKFYVGVDTDNTDIYYKPWIFVSRPPANAGLGTVLFNTDDSFDTWAGARGKLEQYLVAGTVLPGRLLERQLQGQRSFQIYQLPTYPLPEAGEVYVLVYHEGLSDEASQFVRAINISVEERTFRLFFGGSSQSYRDVNFNVVTLEIAETLNQDFDGGNITDDDNYKPPALVRSSRVADAVKLFGIRPLAVEAGLADAVVEVDSIYHTLVPSALRETPLVNINAAGQANGYIQAGNSHTFTTDATLSSTASIWLGSPFLPGSLSITGAATLADDGRGQLVAGSIVVGTANYAAGIIGGITSTPNYGGSKTITFTPAATPIMVAHTTSIGIDQGNRGYVYVQSLDPLPIRGSLKVTYIAAGKVYTLRDQGDGALSGVDSSYGVGQFRWSTNTLTLTLGVLPDPDTEIIIAWGSEVTFHNRSGSTLAAPEFRMQCAHEGGAPGTFTIAWNDGYSRTATDDGAGGLTGDAAGEVQYNQAGGVYIYLRPTNLPAAGTRFTVTYNTGAPTTYTIPAPSEDGNGYIDATLSDLNIIAGTLQVAWTTEGNSGISQWYAYDNGAGGFRLGQIGAINYAAGTLHLHVHKQITRWIGSSRITAEGSITNAQGSKLGIGNSGTERVLTAAYDISQTTEEQFITGNLSIRYRTGNSPDNHVEYFDADTLMLDLTPGFSESIVPGSARFQIGNSTYSETGTGQIMKDINPSTGVGSLAGILDFASGWAMVNNWPAGVTTWSLQALLTAIGDYAASDAVVQMPSRPIRPSSLQIMATKIDGTSINISAPESGTINESDLAGYVNVQTGIVHLRFGNWVTPSGHESEWWYDTRNIRSSDGKIWKPTLIYIKTLRFNAVATSYLPLNAEEIGINPSRFPGDGKILWVQAGDDVVIQNEQSLAISSPITPGQIVPAGRNRLYQVRVLDANQTGVPALASTWGEVRDDANGLTGVAFAASGLNLNAYTQPFKLYHQVLDRSRVLDVDISGRITLQNLLSHGYPAETSYISTALPLGNFLVSAPVHFTQETWTNVWSDNRIGNEPAMQYDSANFPLVLVNEGAITERWAIILTSTTIYKLISENLGIVATGISVNQNFSPANPLTQKAYFTAHAGFLGLGGSVGNVFRFNTTGANRPIWPIVTVLPGESTQESDAFTVQIIGDAL